MDDSQLDFQLPVDDSLFIEHPEQDEKQVHFCFYLELCMSSVSYRITTNSTWVNDEINKDKSATVLINLDEAGNILNIKLVSSSNDIQFDILAIETVNKTAPFTEVSYLNEKDFKQASEISFLFEGSIAREKRIKSYNQQLHRTP